MAVPTPLITRSPERLSGAAVFAGTRVPVQTLIDYLEGGDPLDTFLTDFPDVTREHLPLGDDGFDIYVNEISQPHGISTRSWSVYQLRRGSRRSLSPLILGGNLTKCDEAKQPNCSGIPSSFGRHVNQCNARGWFQRCCATKAR